MQLPDRRHGEAEPFRIDSAEVRRDIERSTLTNIVLNGGAALNYVGNNTVAGTFTFNNTGGITNPTVNSALGISSTTTASSTAVTVATTGTTLAVGQTVTGLGIAQGTTISALTGTTVTLSQAATVAGTNTVARA